MQNTLNRIFSKWTEILTKTYVYIFMYSYDSVYTYKS